MVNTTGGAASAVPGTDQAERAAEASLSSREGLRELDTRPKATRAATPIAARTTIALIITSPVTLLSVLGTTLRNVSDAVATKRVSEKSLASRGNHMANLALAAPDPMEAWLQRLLRLTGACAAVPEQRAHLPRGTAPHTVDSCGEERRAADA
ncbi:hypothetical protein Misp02_34990 [Microtetraspora sp. NBRC 16547]|nr:hypothetical protein Misp02_34990 [Microtetraspora sp. NBRC 16547]